MSFIPNNLSNHWMPFTSEKDFKANPRLLNKGEGLYYWSTDGDKILDASSGLFCSALGHCRPEITAAVSRQLSELDYNPHFQIGSPPSFELARRLAEITPGSLNKIFFVNSGSESIDTALKISMAYHLANGEGHRNKYISRERAYHGVNIGGTSLSGMMRNRQTFGAVMPGIAHMRHTWLPAQRFQLGQPNVGEELAEDLQRFVELYGGSNIAACLVEPIAGSTGILVPPVGYLERLREICDANGILLIFDEVICGFGRTGSAFASQSFNVTPDIMTMAKAMTNGAIPMGAVAVKEEIYDVISDAAAEGAVELFHGYTYSGHPVASAAALATLDIYEQENVFNRVAEMSTYFLETIFSLQDSPEVVDIRGYGLLAGVEIKPKGAPGARGLAVSKRLFEAGMHLRFSGDVGIISPPLVAEKSHIDDICGLLREALKTV